MSEYVGKEGLSEAILSINRWHPNTPLILLFSKLKGRPYSANAINSISISKSRGQEATLTNVRAGNSSSVKYLR